MDGPLGNLTLNVTLNRSWMGHHAPQTPLECVSKESASRLAVTEKLAQTRSLISVESVEVITRAARRCQDSSQSLCEYSAHDCHSSFLPHVKMTPLL